MEVLFCEIDDRVLGGMQFRVLVEVPLCETCGRVLGGMQCAVLIKVLVPVLFKALMDSGWAPQFGVLFEVLVMGRRILARLMAACSLGS